MRTEQRADANAGSAWDRRRLPPPRLIVFAALGYLATALAASYAVDAHDAFGVRTRLLGLGMNYPAPWFHVFGTRKLTSILQWSLLAAAVPLAGVLAGRLAERGRRGAASFWLLIAAATSLMLWEDGGNVRDIVRAYILDLSPRYEFAVSITVLLIVFGAISAVALYALARFGGSVWGVRASRPYLLLAYLALGVAALGDVGAWFGMYEGAGLFVQDTVTQGRLVVFPGHTRLTQATLFMDSVWEESLELLGYAAFLAAVCAYWNAEIARPAAAASAIDT